jgi:hypothetical protein
MPAFLKRSAKAVHPEGRQLFNFLPATRNARLHEVNGAKSLIPHYCPACQAISTWLIEHTVMVPRHLLYSLRAADAIPQREI